MYVDIYTYTLVWLQRESMTAGHISFFSRGLMQLERTFGLNNLLVEAVEIFRIGPDRGLSTFCQQKL